jgi:hypothetical protein
MSVGRNLQEMENVVTKGASPAETPSKSATPILTPGQTGSWEDLGGPTPENYRPDDDSSKLKDPATTLAQVRDVVNAKASAADSMKGVKEETEEDEDLVDEEEVDEDEEVVAEESCEDEEEDGPKPKKTVKSLLKKILKKMKMK